VEVAEFHYQPTRWPRSYRFVVIRRLQPEEPSEQLTLFELGRYHYQVGHRSDFAAAQPLVILQ
jgi:hypothetical protein